MDQPKINSGSIVLRLLVVGLLVLLLLIPTGLISALIREREQRKREAVAEVASKWAGAQTLGGPVVTIPYEKSGGMRTASLNPPSSTSPSSRKPWTSRPF